jgi:hypothetical protein
MKSSENIAAFFCHMGENGFLCAVAVERFG